MLPFGARQTKSRWAGGARAVCIGGVSGGCGGVCLRTQHMLSDNEAAGTHIVIKPDTMLCCAMLSVIPTLPPPPRTNTHNMAG